MLFCLNSTGRKNMERTKVCNLRSLPQTTKRTLSVFLLPHWNSSHPFQVLSLLLVLLTIWTATARELNSKEKFENRLRHFSDSHISYSPNRLISTSFFGEHSSTLPPFWNALQIYQHQKQEKEYNIKYDNETIVDRRSTTVASTISTDDEIKSALASSDDHQIFLRLYSVRVILVVLYTVVFLAIFIGKLCQSFSDSFNSTLK